jgi:hypothetical protein
MNYVIKGTRGTVNGNDGIVTDILCAGIRRYALAQPTWQFVASRIVKQRRFEASPQL